PVELHVPTGEEVGYRRAVLREERRLDAGCTLREGFRDAFLHAGLVRGREEIQRVHARDLFARVSAHALEVAIPAQETSFAVVEVHDARQAIEQRRGEELLVAQDLLRLAQGGRGGG